MSLGSLRERIADKMSGPSGQPCRVCGTITPWVTLSEHGGLCMGCFKAYCQAVPVAPVAEPAHDEK